MVIPMLVLTGQGYISRYTDFFNTLFIEPIVGDISPKRPLRSINFPLPTLPIIKEENMNSQIYTVNDRWYIFLPTERQISKMKTVSVFAFILVRGIPFFLNHARLRDGERAPFITGLALQFACSAIPFARRPSKRFSMVHI